MVPAEEWPVSKVGDPLLGGGRHGPPRCGQVLFFARRGFRHRRFAQPASVAMVKLKKSLKKFTRAKLGTEIKERKKFQTRRDRREGHKKRRVATGKDDEPKEQPEQPGPDGLVDEDEGVAAQGPDTGDFEQYLERELAALQGEDDEEGGGEGAVDDDDDDDDDGGGGDVGEEGQDGEDSAAAAQQHALELKELAATDPGA